MDNLQFSIELTIVHDKSFEPKQVPAKSVDFKYLEKKAPILKATIEYATCCLKAIDPNRKHNSVVKCKSCNHSFHKVCVDHQSKLPYNCGFCTMPKNGIKWSAGLDNTCPLDATFQPIIIRCLDEPKFLEAITKSTYGFSKIGQTIQTAVDLARQNKWADLHVLWAQSTQLSGKSMYGSTKEIFWNHLKPCGTFSYDEKCEECRSRKIIKSNPSIPFADMNISPSDNIELLFLGKSLQLDCGNCKNNRKIQTKYVPDSKNTWFCVLEVDLMPHYAEEFFKIPKSLQFGPYQFTLAGFVVLKSQSKY